VKDYTMCFARGQENPIGLRLIFRREGETVRTKCTPGELHQGWPAIVHGGIINTILDEAMSYVPFFQGLNNVTAKMEVRLRNAAQVGQQLFISSRITEKTRNFVEAKAKTALEDGTTRRRVRQHCILWRGPSRG